MDSFLRLMFFCTFVCFLGLIYKTRCISEELKQMNKNLLYLSRNIQEQTSQQSWLVSHYLKPVRGIFPWDINHCEYCGSKKQEWQTEEDLNKKLNFHENF